MFRKVVIGISGGVDSAVSALLLKQRGFDVNGVFMKNWEEIDEFGQCNGDKEWLDAQLICKKLNIPLKQVNFVKEYWNYVFWQFLEDYQIGLTPNPDILCNKYIKFDKFFNYAKKILNADAIATGHYAQTNFGSFLENYQENTNVKLLQSTDDFKDQTFFLSNIQQNTLRYTMFPIGTLKKSQVKEIAKKFDLHEIAKKRESTGICFIGQRNFKKFINEYIPKKPGNFIDIDTNSIVGIHEGIHQWTLGQRCCISGCLKPYFIARKDVLNNIIYVASGTDHPSLFSKNFLINEPHWINKSSIKFKYTDNNNEIFECKFRFQHTKPLVNCKIMKNSNFEWIVQLDKPLRAITPGQYAVFYLNNECLGSARILNPIVINELVNSTNNNDRNYNLKSEMNVMENFR